MSERQSQRVSDQSVAVQVGSVHIEGISEERAHLIAREVFESELARYTATAAHIAEARVDQLRIEIIDRIKQLDADKLTAFEDPDVQLLLRDAQQEYARSGDDHHVHVLADLIAVRCAGTGDGLEKGAIRAAVETVGRLSKSCIAAVTVCWLMTTVKFVRVENRAWLTEFASKHLAPFVADLPTSEKEYNYLDGTGCVSLTRGFATTGSVVDRMLRTYPGLFQNGLTPDELDEKLQPLFESHSDGDAALFMPCFGDSTKWQVAALDHNVASRAIERASSDPGVREAYTSLLTNNRIPADKDIEALLCAAHPAWATLLDRFSTTSLSAMRVNSVGTAIAHCNWSSTTGSKAPLSIWV